MNKRIQTNCIQTVLFQNGKLQHYRLTLPVPINMYIEDKVVNNFGAKVEYVKRKKFITYTSENWDELETVKAQMQLYITNLKIKDLNFKRTNLLSFLTKTV